MLATLCLLATLAGPSAATVTPVPPGGRVDVPLDRLAAGATYRATVTLVGTIEPGTSARVVLAAPGGFERAKALNPGDPDVFWSFRPPAAGQGSLTVGADGRNRSPLQVRVDWGRRDVATAADVAAIEAEPNDSWREANPLVLGRPVHGSADDVDDLDNPAEGRSGLDWFRFEIPAGPPVLAFFFLELLDRDVSANLRVYRLDPVRGESPYEGGKDPTEVVHDRERERYSTHLSRTFAAGTYFVEVNANHPDYILRTRTSPIPPYQDDPRQAVDVGLQYLLEAGDAWFDQIPREGNRTSRSANLHDTATRCTACHASTYPVEAALVGHRAGYPIRAKQSLLYLTDRLANSPTPLYGGEGLFWQRFIAIPLQAQGKQGGVLLDFARQVDGRDAAGVDRFGPFLRAAWRGRWELPADESNGVVPPDSKFGSAWRDWRVLTEMTARTKQVAYAGAADAIADLLADPATDARVETLQDRMHRLHAWTVVDPDRFAPRIKAEADALLALQNPDGGWHELGQPGRPSAVYATGQMAWTLMQAGIPRDDPRIARALALLLARQQSFGGWFETTTHENFRTPMRETRYALEALALGFPRADRPLTSWGNRDEGPARVPQPGSLAAVLGDLDDLWDVPEPDRPRFARGIIPFLDDPDPIVRGRAAAALGRLGAGSAVEPLARLLGDPSKIAARSAAWSLRKLGNRGIGVATIGQALRSPDPATRRGAVRIFAQQFWGLDPRVELADALIALTSDPDFLVRLEAIRSLRQWFYRTADVGLQRRIVAAYLARMALPDEPVIRRALAEGMYIMLDENLGGGVSLGRTLMVLPERSRRRALAGREAVERDVLLGPILAALEGGNALQREALVRSFDGSFFAGRSYARRPTGMIDVGNDREFGFLYEPPVDLLDRVFAALLPAPDLSAAPRAGAIRLASFFLVAGRTTDPAIQASLLHGLLDPDAAVRLAARDGVGRDLSLLGAEADPARVELIRRVLAGDDAGRRAVVAALGRSPGLLAVPAIVADLRAKVADDAAVVGLAPVLRDPAFAAAEVNEAAARAWPLATEPADRLAWLDALLARPAAGAGADPAAVVDLFRRAGRDPAGSVRERALEAVGASPRFAASRAGEALLLAALADDVPGARRRALDLADDRAGFWDGGEARERLRARLADPDAAVRARALAIVGRRRLAGADPAVARRVRALAADPTLGVEADAILRSQGLDPGSIPPDVRPGRRRLPSLATFRDRVDPLYRRPGEDGVSCVQCHANQNGFRVVAAGGEMTAGEALAINYRSTLKALDRGDPEASLLFRKPRSPRGAGDGDPASPTALTHNGGPRWDADHPAYAALRNWIAEADADRRPPRDQDRRRRLQTRVRAGTGDGWRPRHGLADRDRGRPPRLSPRAGRRPRLDPAGRRPADRPPAGSARRARRAVRDRPLARRDDLGRPRRPGDLARRPRVPVRPARGAGPVRPPPGAGRGRRRADDEPGRAGGRRHARRPRGPAVTAGSAGPRAWFPARGVAAWVALVAGMAALDSLVVLVHHWPLAVAISAGVAGLFALGGIRRPWFFGGVVLALMVALPPVHDSSAHDLFGRSVALAWLAGAGAGGISRLVRRSRRGPPG